MSIRSASASRTESLERVSEARCLAHAPSAGPMTAFTNDASIRDLGREAPLLFGGWEVGLLVIMALLYAVGLYLNPAFFGSTDALFSVLRDASRYGVLAIGMTFVIVNKELDLSVGSTFGLTATIFGMIFAPTYFDMDIWTAVSWCLVMGLVIGLINGFMVTVLEVPAFIATLTMLFIGRGVILGLTGGKNIAFEIKAGDYPAFFRLGEVNSLSFNNQIIVFVVIAAGRRRGACLHHDWLDDLLRRRQRASGALRRHQNALRAHALLCPLLSLRGDRGPDERRAEQGRGPAGRLWPGADRHFVGDRRRSGDFWRPGTHLRLLPRRHSHRAYRQGSARGRADHAHDRPWRWRDRAGGGDGAIAARRGSRRSRRRSDRRGLDRALARAASRDPPPLGLAARPAAPADSRSRQRRGHGRPDPRRERAGARAWASAGSPPSSIAETRRR